MIFQGLPERAGKLYAPIYWLYCSQNSQASMMVLASLAQILSRFHNVLLTLSQSSRMTTNPHDERRTLANEIANTSGNWIKLGGEAT